MFEPSTGRPHNGPTITVSVASVVITAALVCDVLVLTFVFGDFVLFGAIGVVLVALLVLAVPRIGANPSEGPTRRRA